MHHAEFIPLTLEQLMYLQQFGGALCDIIGCIRLDVCHICECEQECFNRELERRNERWLKENREKARWKKNE